MSASACQWASGGEIPVVVGIAAIDQRVALVDHASV
jgi:hypothetical protein